MKTALIPSRTQKEGNPGRRGHGSREGAIGEGAKRSPTPPKEGGMGHPGF